MLSGAREAKWSKIEDAPNAHEYVLEVHDSLGPWADDLLGISAFDFIMDRYLPNVRAELLSVIETRAHLQRKDLDMASDVDKPRIIIPPSISIGERDIQLSFRSVGDGMFFELRAQEGDEPGANDLILFRFYPGKGFYMAPGAVLQTTPDFPVDEEGRMQLIDDGQKKLLEVYPEQVKGKDESGKPGEVTWNGNKWRLVSDGSRMYVEVRTGKGNKKLGVLSITKQGIERWNGVPEEYTGIANDEDGTRVAIHE